MNIYENKCTCMKWAGSDTISEYSPNCPVVGHSKKANPLYTKKEIFKGMSKDLKLMGKAKKY